MSIGYSNNKIPFGLKDGNLVSVSEVPQGLACGCVCPECKRRLQANKGDVVAHYFSHDPSEETKSCESAFETAIHLMAKQLLSEDGSLSTPDLTVMLNRVDINGRNHEESVCVEAPGLRSFDRVDLEKRLEGIRPDIIAYIDDKPLLIEIAVTCFADRNKKRIISELGLPAIEIDLRNLSYSISKDELRNHLSGSKSKIRWLYNPCECIAKKHLSAKLDQKVSLVNAAIRSEDRRAREKLKSTLLKNKKAKITEKKQQNTVKAYEVCTIFCKACRHIFKIPPQDAPCLKMSIPCPECNRPVSTESVRR